MSIQINTQKNQKKKKKITSYEPYVPESQTSEYGQKQKFLIEDNIDDNKKGDIKGCIRVRP